MRSIGKMVDNTRHFLGEVRTEVHKSTWPNRKELVEHTIVTILFVIIVTTYVGICDWLLINIIGLFFK